MIDPGKLHGTRAAEARHRRTDTWPCQTCMTVRADIETQWHTRYKTPTIPPPVLAALTELERWTWWNEPERLDVCRHAARTTSDLTGFARTVGLPLHLARPLMRWIVLQEGATDGASMGAA